jgi:Domain of unknown function (DUF4112)
MMAYSVMRLCQSVEPALPSDVKRSMFWNLIIDFVIGFVPILGDLADAAYKCNTKNAVLLEKELNKRADKRERQAGGIPTTRPIVVDEGIEMATTDGAPPRYTSTKKPKRPEEVYDPRHPSNGRVAGGRQEADLETEEIASEYPIHQSSRSHRNDVR